MAQIPPKNIFLVEMIQNIALFYFPNKFWAKINFMFFVYGPNPTKYHFAGGGNDFQRKS